MGTDRPVASPPAATAARGSHPDAASVVLAAGVLAIGCGFALLARATGSATGTVLGWAATVVLGLLLPGGLVAFVGSGRRLPWPDALGWALPVGAVLQLLTWLVGRLLDVHVSASGAGVAVSAATVLWLWTRAAPDGVPGRDGRPAALRRPALRRPALRRTGDAPPWSLALAVAVLLATTAALLRVAAGFRSSGPVPAGTGPGYFQDALFQVALAGELRHHLPPQYPMVAGTPLGYHWFVHALGAQLAGGGASARTDTDVMTRLLLGTVVLALPLLAATVTRGWLRHRSAAGPGLAALLVGAVGAARMDPWGDRNPLIATYWQSSATGTLGWLAGLACLGALAPWLLGRGRDGIPRWWLGPFALLAAGAKSSQLLPLVGGVATYGAVVLLDRRARRRPGSTRSPLWAVVGAGAVLTAAMLFGVLALYPGTYGMVLDPVGARTAWTRPSFPRADGSYLTDPWVFAGAVVRYLAAHLLPLAGTLVLLVRRPREPLAWVGVGCVAAAVVPLLLFRHPGMSQLYVLVAAYPLLCVTAAAGLATWFEDVRDRSGTARGRHLLVAGTAACLAAGVGIALAWRSLEAPLQQGEWLGSGAAVTGGLALVVAAAVAGLLAVVGVGRGVLRPGSVLGLAAVVLVGLSLPGAARSLDPLRAPVWGSGTANPDLVRTTPALQRAGDVVRRSAAPDDVVATNRYRIIDNGAWGDARDFTVSAFTGRRTDVSGYAYAPRNFARSEAIGSSYPSTTFWDPPRLEAELALVTAPTEEGLARAWRRGTRWVVADERAGPVSPVLATLTDRVFLEDGVHVYRLRPPAAAPRAAGQG